MTEYPHELKSGSLSCNLHSTYTLLCCLEIFFTRTTQISTSGNNVKSTHKVAPSPFTVLKLGFCYFLPYLPQRISVDNSMAPIMLSYESVFAWFSTAQWTHQMNHFVVASWQVINMHVGNINDLKGPVLILLLATSSQQNGAKTDWKERLCGSSCFFLLEISCSFVPQRNLKGSLPSFFSNQCRECAACYLFHLKVYCHKYTAKFGQ